MKKWIIAACSLFLLFLIGIYFFIPPKIVVAKSVTINANRDGVYRFLNNESNWTTWWPPGLSKFNNGAETVFESGGYRFKKTKALYNSFEITIEKDKNFDSSLLHIFSLSNDSIKIQWNATIHTGTNPFSKAYHYFRAKELSNSLAVILTAMQKHISQVRYIYGIDIKREKVKIEYLVSTKKSFLYYPTTQDIYEMVGQIKKHIVREQAIEEDYPMLHINPSDSAHFEAQVAIPVNKKLPDAGIFAFKKILKYGNILAAEIVGGNNTVDWAMKQMDRYATDYQYSNVALPFESLVTDRRQETDTSKWVTKIYYPIR